MEYLSLQCCRILKSLPMRISHVSDGGISWDVHGGPASCKLEGLQAEAEIQGTPHAFISRNNPIFTHVWKP